MSLDLNRDQFGSLPRHKKDLVIFDNLQEIKTSIGLQNKEIQKQQTKMIGLSVWSFLLTVAFGFKKYLPI